MKRKRSTACTAAATALLLLSACKGAGASERASDGVLRIGDTGSTISTLNPFVASNVFELAIFRYVYPHLVQYGTGSEIEGDFASSYDASADGLTWTFHTRPGAKWSDGKDLTAEDAAWTFQQILAHKDGPTARLASYLQHVTKVEAGGKDELTVTLDAPLATALSQISQVPILPRQVWQEPLSGDASQLKNFTNDAPLVSGGSFILTDQKKGAFALFKANSNFYGRKPKLKGFGLQFFGSADAMVTVLRQGQIDVAYDVPATAAKTLKAEPSLDLLTTSGMDEDFLIFNSSSGQRAHPELLEPKVREAFHLAIDRKKLVDVVTLGMGAAATSVIPPSLAPWYDPATGAEGLDVASANSILDGLGFARGSDGIRIANGHPMAYELLQPTGLTGHDRVVDLVRADLAAIGVKVTPKIVDGDAFGQLLVTPSEKAPSYDLAMDDWVSKRDPDFMLSLFTCAQIGNRNEGAYCSQDYEALYNQQATTLDSGARRDAVVKAQQFLDKEKPWIPQFANPNIIAVNKKVKGFNGSPFVIDHTSRHQIDDVRLG
ncbi:ABC transporter substrate-binding protein [Planosporangium thailandense]|uniref:ABC transporter substrate-binding protein n=1 Tax=Planosporangium thailandense TaxID=765197 RepID=A0ABX0Y742_9ACTN|nr:ABC transporter substrate-binding protein [Planosporangium thailandense]NJC73238.1 ABC transporter substrate-binding protein [Planosporangium thailandense]